jgi:hypothetical protein
MLIKRRVVDGAGTAKERVVVRHSAIIPRAGYAELTFERFHGEGWEAVASDGFGSISMDGQEDGLAIGYGDPFIVFRVNGAWTPSPFKGQIVGVVGAGLPGATAYVTVGEAQNNTDYNGDGDKSDFVLRYAVGSNELQVEADLIGRISNPPARSFEEGGAVAFVVTETVADLNGDGDTNDIVVHIVDKGVVTNMRVAIDDRQNLFIPSFSDGEQSGRVVANTAEFFQGADLNGDGDLLDIIEVAFRRLATVGAIQPARLLDTRSGVGYTGPKPTAGQTLTLQS